MWRVKFVYFNPIVEFEDDVYVDFHSDLDAWRFHDLVFKSPSVVAVYKPYLID